MANKTPRVVISSGHGLSSRSAGDFDPGAGGTEAKRVYDMASRVVADLRALAYRGMTADHRAAGYFAQADDDAVKFHADAFIELHLNAGGGHGTETYTATTYTKSEDRLAHIIQRRVVAALGTTDRGVKRTTFAVLRPHEGMASVLPELYFIDSAGDRRKAEENDTALELALLNAVLEYFGWKPVKTRPRLWGPIRRARYRPF